MNRASCTYLLCALAIATTPLRVSAAAPEVIDISIADTFDAEERKLLEQWMQDAAKEGMRSVNVSESDSDSSARRLVIEVTGAAPDYHLVIGVRAGTTWVDKRERHCACGDAELFDSVQADVAAVAPSLRASATVAEPSGTAPAAAPASTSPSDLQPERRPLSAKGIVGAAFIPLGVGVLGAGVWMAVVGKKRVAGDDEAASETNLRPGGIGLAVAGGAVLATGVALLVIDLRARKRDRRAVVVPMRNGFAVVGRF